MKWWTVFLFFTGLLLVSCSASTGYTNVSAAEAKKMIEKKEVTVIDVRTEEEFASGHIPNAKLLPLQQLQDRLGELDKNQAYLIVCRSGNRSAQASEILANEGFSHIYNMIGGMSKWDGAVETE